jgi:hypothetical protein
VVHSAPALIHGVLTAPKFCLPTKATTYIERNAPGTAKGWRWQKSWSGVYSIVINENIVEDWWDEQAINRFVKSPG